MRRLAHALRRFARCQRGATVVEYGLLVAMLSIVVIGAVTAAGVSLYGVMNNMSARIAAAH